MEKRIQIDEIEPKSFQGMFSLEKYLSETQLSKSQMELIKMRASQINGCAFCLDMHSKDAINHGESAKRLLLLDAWRESGLFSQEEQIILKVTEEVTLIHVQGLSSSTYEEAMEVLGESLLAQTIMAATTINAWNRIAISTHKPIPE
ncbi:carboxymuconolactone decarboxylase family protein [Roseivirga sp.]|uniref:carboxymuconolactone decarboxylase family protein n=1 Tax=Roseivirga sp. TaxID=1964215 RepID=UPI003B51FA82